MSNLDSNKALTVSMLTLTTFGMLMPSFIDIHQNSAHSAIGESARFAEHLVTVTVLSIVGVSALLSKDYSSVVVALATVALMTAVYEYALGTDAHHA